MNSLLLFILLSFNLVSSTTIAGTVVKMKLMSSKMLRNISSNQKEILKNDDVVIISEKIKPMGMGQVLTRNILIH